MWHQQEHRGIREIDETTEHNRESMIEESQSREGSSCDTNEERGARWHGTHKEIEAIRKLNQLDLVLRERIAKRLLENPFDSPKDDLARRDIDCHCDTIAEHMGVTCLDTVTRKERRALIRREKGANIPLRVQQLFYRANLVMEVADPLGEIHFIVVEASYTADQRNVEIALCNATLLAWLTGRPSHPTIAGRQYDPAVQPFIDNAAVYWYPLHDDDFIPDH